MDWFPEFVRKHLTFTGKCYGHCDKSTAMKVLSKDSDHVLGAYICPDGVASHVVYFSLKPDLAWFEKLLSDQVGRENVESRDIRLATRHGWELGRGARDELEAQLACQSSIKEVYWRRYPKTDEQKQMNVSLCVGNESDAGCLKLFMQPKGSNQRLCPTCHGDLA